ncbi:MAG TPA: sulfur carrier protein ThiS [Bryobacteraceae bacterium]|nr:sulfur carrier protein ThiS [Bryobacteraceae bacterium]
MQIVLNGEPREVPENITVLGLLRYIAVPPERVAVELDREIVRKQDWERAVVRPGAQVEVVMFVGGG